MYSLARDYGNSLILLNKSFFLSNNIFLEIAWKVPLVIDRNSYDLRFEHRKIQWIERTFNTKIFESKKFANNEIILCLCKYISDRINSIKNNMNRMIRKVYKKKGVSHSKT